MNNKILEAINKLKINYLWENGMCSECYYDSAYDQLPHACGRVNEVLELLEEEIKQTDN